MWVNKGKAFAVHHILESKVFEEFRFTRTGLTDHIQVAAAVVITEANCLAHAAEFVIAQQKAGFDDIGWAIHLLAHLALDLRSWDILLVWQVEERSKLHTIEHIGTDTLREKAEDIGRYQIIHIMGRHEAQAIAAWRIKHRKGGHHLLHQALGISRCIG